MQEFRLLQHVYATGGKPDSRVILPPGDDMAQVRLGGRDLLVAVDQVVGGRHFDPATTPIEFVGRKAMTRSLSDIAAMAGSPVASVVAVSLPADFGETRACALFDAMHRTAATFDCPLIGGDICIHDGPLVCSVTVLAEPTTPSPVTRGGACAGDGVYVTGALGGAVESGRHLSFEPRIATAVTLAATLGERLHAMIDLSDGLGRDAGHLAEQGDRRIEIDADSIPRSTGVADWMSAVSDGEDYELCFAATGPVPSEIDGVPITRVGEVTTGAPGVFVRASGRMLAAGDLGWQHES